MMKHKAWRYLCIFCVMMLCISCVMISGVAAEGESTLVTYDFSQVQLTQMYEQWYCDHWENVTIENGALTAQNLLFSRQAYRQYAVNFDLATQGSHTSFAKTYLALRQPTGYMLGGDLLALNQNDLGNDNQDARPGRMGLLIGMARNQIEVIVHTMDEDGNISNVHVLLDLPEGKDFRDGRAVQIEDTPDSIQVLIDQTLVAQITLSEPTSYTAWGYEGHIYQKAVVTGAGGSEMLVTENAFVPTEGMFGFVGKGGRYTISDLSVSAICENPQDAIISAPSFDHELIYLEKAPETEKGVETFPTDVSTDPSVSTEYVEADTGALIPTVIKGFSDTEKTVLIVLIVLLNLLLISRGIWCFVLMKGDKKQKICLVILAVVLLASDIVMPICMANLPQDTTVMLPNEDATKQTIPDTELDTEVETSGEAEMPPTQTPQKTYPLDANGNPAPVVIDSSNQTATDALGRVLPTYEEVGDVKEGRYVGVFYTLWTMSSGAVQDNSKILARNPLDPRYGPQYSFHWWGEPEVGYASSTDEWVARRNMQYLAEAGVDYIYLDFTNGGIYEPAFEVLLDVCLEMRAEGMRTPGIVPWVYGDDSGTYRDIGYLYRTYYSQEKYKELWFYMDGKPLVMLKRVEDSVAQYRTDNKYLPALNTPEIKDFFTIRFAWVPSEEEGGHYPGERVYRWTWGTPLFMHAYKENVYSYGWDERVRQAEQATIIVGGYCNIGYGRSGETGELDQFNEKTVSGEGLYLQYQFDWIMEKHPELEYLNISGWNEWIAQYFPEESSLSFGFVDSYNREFSRDIEPMKGGYTDNYYYQMCAIIRKFKGMSAPDKQENQVTIDMDNLDVWDGLTQGVYTDYVGDTAWRDGTDPSGTIRYVNQTGRNDIAESKIAYDAGYVYVYAGTKSNLTPHTDKHWMLLFIDSDADTNTGWEGYDYAVNLEVLDESHTTLCKYQNGVWQEIGVLNYKYQDNKIHIAIPRSLIAQAGESIKFNFHWMDNVTDIYDMYSWFTTGDSAPERRNRYVFEATCAYDAKAETILDERTSGQIKYMPAKDAPANAQNGLSVQKFRITENYGKQPEIDLLEGDGGNLIYGGVAEDVGLIEQAPRNAYALRFDGYVHVKESGEVTFTLTADDGAMLYIDGRLVIDMSGVHTVQTNSGSILLEEGYHEIRVEYFENGNGGSTLLLESSQIDGYVTVKE